MFIYTSRVPEKFFLVIMSHEWNDDKSQDYLSGILQQGASMDAASKALAKDAVGWQHEFILHQPLIPFDYNINEAGRWVDGGGKTVEELNDPNDIGGDRIGRTLHAESGLMSNPDVKMAATISPDLGYGRSFVYLYSRGENNTIKALAVEFKGTDAQLQRFFTGLGLQGGADISKSADQNQALFFTKEVGVNQIFEEAKNSLSGDSSQNEYLDRLSRSTSAYPLLLEERNRQVEQYAAKALETMLAQENVRQGLAMAVFGVIELASQTTDSTAKHIYEGSVETISGVFEYISKRHDDESRSIIAPEFSNEDWVIPSTVEALLMQQEHTESLLLLSTEPDESLHLSESELVSVWKQIAKDSLQLSTEQSDFLYTDVQEAYEITKTAEQILVRSISDESMPIGGALFALDVLSGNMEEFSIEHQVPTAAESHNENSEDSSVPVVIIKEDKTTHILEEKGISAELIEVTNELLEQQKSGVNDSSSVDYETLILTVDMLQILHQASQSERMHIVTTEKKHVQERIESLHEILLDLIHHNQNSEPTAVPRAYTDREINDTRRASESISEAQHVRQFSFAVTVMLLYKYMNYFSSLEKIQSVLQRQREHGTDTATSPMSLYESIKDSPDGIIRKEPSSWLLFAIIWHLAMIREQGFAQSTGTNKQKTKKKKDKKIYPNTVSIGIRTPGNITVPSGVIYAFSHAMIEL